MASLQEIFEELTKAPGIAGAILGSLLGFFFIFLGFLYDFIMNSIPGNNVLRDFRKGDIANIFVKYLYNDNSIYWMPLAWNNPESPKAKKVINTPFVIDLADFKAIADVIIPIGKYGKLKKIEYFSPTNFLTNGINRMCVLVQVKKQ